ncbi:uncharacterized protein DUF3291 [Actinomycetospora succinea]|uniref:Uncharacterized protein DUF3291 n=1 Tax=Actinomycetospora succinea TaxID=663603 RepID=A0A4R6VEF9_9PSEU|nr:DUF3291 domain-containing protein [Actinomycetospora succinea]TDQ61152.1 uncharacterized protein DUF3291 [Actinomycetospora succinea]
MAQLAQVNAAVLRFPLDDARLAGFLTAVDRIGTLAERAPGFVWRHPDAHVQPRVETIVNLSVWTDYPSLHRFVYRSAHGQLVRRRGEWFRHTTGPTTALWWVRDGHEPTPDEALARLTYLRAHGPTSRAFTVRRRFDAEGRPERR